MITKEEDSNQTEEIKELPPEPVDCIVEVEVAVGGLSARILAHEPKYDGKPISSEIIDKALADAGVVYGIDNNAIDNIVNENRYEDWFEVAKCKPAENGENGTITYLINIKEETHLHEDAKGFVNYKDLGIVNNITRGTKIADITLPTEGNPGISVKNEPIVQVKGNPAKVTFAENIAYSDNNLSLVAQCDGNLVMKSGRYSVERIFRLDGDVDVSTGNIDFIGEVVIRGDVKEGFSVKAKKSITVQGGVYGSVLESGENIIIRQGAMGSTLTANGKIEVDFCEKVNIKCSELLKTKSLYFCDTFCKGKIDVTMSNGSIVGGKTVSTQNISANNIGSQSYTPTLIVVGDNAIMLQEKNVLSAKLETISTEVENCNKIISFLQSKAKQLGELPQDKIDILKSATTTIIMKKRDKENLQSRIDEIDDYLKTKQNISLSCRKQMNPGTKVVINDQVFVVNTVYDHCILGLGKDGIVVNTL